MSSTAKREVLAAFDRTAAYLRDYLAAYLDQEGVTPEEIRCVELDLRATGGGVKATTHAEGL